MRSVKEMKDRQLAQAREMNDGTPDVEKGAHVEKVED